MVLKQMLFDQSEEKKIRTSQEGNNDEIQGEETIVEKTIVTV